MSVTFFLEGCEVIQGEVSPDRTVTFECAQPNITPEESAVLQPVTTLAMDASKPANKRAFRSTVSDHKTTAKRKLFSPAKQTVLADSDTTALVSDLENAGVHLTNELLVLPLHDLDIVEETISPLESDELLHNDEETIASTNQDEEFNPEEQNIPSSDEEPSPKKRRQRKDTWKVNKIKQLRNSGQAYVNFKGKQVEAKFLKGPCQCRHKCYAKINEDQRQKIHNKIWAIGTPRGQWDFMSKHVEVIGVKRRTTENKPVRQWTYKYKFKAMDGPHVYVCREMFLNTLSISPQRLRTAFDKLDRKEGIISPDKRGKHAKLTPASKRVTANPKKDQCSKCLVFKSLSPAQKQEKEEDYNEHIKNKTRAREKKEKDVENAEPSVCVCTFDLEKTLYCPKGEDAHFYYLSKLKCYNFTIFQSNVKQGHSYVWDETIAHRGADEFASCQFIFIPEKASEGYKEFHFYSDNCSSQNKNKVLFSMYNFASHRFNVVITHRYLDVTHTQMECDSMHALIERRSKNVTVYAPSQWHAIIKAAKLTPPIYQVKEMLQENFLSFSRVTEEHNWSQLPSSKVREIQVCKNEALYKTAYGGPVTTINPMRPRPGRPLNWTTIELQPSTSERLPVLDKVMKVLRGLCEKGSIPATYHEFYYGIPTLPPKPKNTGARKRKKPPNGNDNDTANNEEEGVEEDEDDPGDSNDVEDEVDESEEDSESDEGNEEDVNE
ncbi:LOW QUALITY PROTEIN: Leucyl/phenylalanyl-tRNA--protein transferase [Frankliniella fusca]|uniref:Leucyl/phenylalanyl-tRNA--protein transferase n=1 Tax=Frankliniella fusca TaxID=407009 RepID=A0AAE1I1E5_9NEOP|nr:LOW QUALITY PROTEIN: Leucyl/phenylalanyl-tRNA--protein transferase [Frankliniella fusca]